MSCGISSTTLLPCLRQWLYTAAGARTSAHLSATAKGRIQLTVLPLLARAVAVARTPCDATPMSGPKKVGSGALPNSLFRYTSTRTHEPAIPAGHAHDTCATGDSVQTSFSVAAFRAASAARPVSDGGLSRSS